MRAVIYARYSTDMQSTASVEDQVHACTSFIERQGWTSGETFSDRAQSGASMLRPGLQDLISHVTDGACDVVVAEALDRLSRDQADIAALYKRLRFGTCDSRKGIRRDRLEALILDLLKERLLEPEPTSVFVSAYNASLRDHEAKVDGDRRTLQAELDKVSRQLEGLYDAIGDGLRTDGLLGRVRDLEARQAELRDEIETPDQPPVRLHPRLGDLYRAAVADLATRLTDPAIREEASALLRRLIDKVVVHQEDAGQEIELHGSILSLVNLANPAEVTERSLSSVKVVAGVGFEPTTFRL